MNILDDHNRDGVVDGADDESDRVVVLAAQVARKELDKGGSYSQAKAKAFETARSRGVPPERASKSARTGTVNAVGDKVSDGISKDLENERIIRFSPPRELGLGDTTVVEAVILRRSTEALQQQSARQGREINATIKVERVMQADLNGIQFTIDPPEADDREWKPTSRSEWSWQITPNTSGSQTLSLTIMGLINVNGMSTGTNFESLNREVEVTQTLWQRISGTLGAAWWPAFYAILAALGGWALWGWRRYRMGHDQREEHDE